VRANAQYDAAAALIGIKDWAGAARQLEDFRQRFPAHPLQREVAGKLAVAYTEQGRWAAAAGEFERLAAAATDSKVARDAQWHAAELYEKGGARAPAAKAYERYVEQHPQPLEPAVEARWRLAQLAKEGGQSARELALVQDVMQADAAGGDARTPRTRTLGALAALRLSAPTLEAYRKVTLVEPLQRQLKLKKARMEDVLKAYAVVSEYGVPAATTAATFHTAAVYQDFGKALLASQRPKKLSQAELEQYNVMLEEQAFPFEEKAIELHEVNARRATEGVYDEWVQASFTALRELRPVRYAKTERAEAVIDAIR
jgi:tetratricopeptide (TPR) repeat protein